jgi:hypothetical protein
VSETQKTSAYAIDSDQRTALEEKVLANLNAESVVKQIKTRLDEFCQQAIDATTDYLKDEYSLVFDDIVRERAKRLVCELLKGNPTVAEAFQLKAGVTHWGADAGKPFVYDPDGVREAIVERFKCEIVNAEMTALKKENESLKRDLKYCREREARNY